jgi:hypothetical protein
MRFIALAIRPVCLPRQMPSFDTGLRQAQPLLRMSGKERNHSDPLILSSH